MTRLSVTIAAIFMVTARPALSAAPVLRAADARIRIASRTSCDVRLSVTIDGATEVEHRLAVHDGDTRQFLSVDGATLIEPIRDVGSTLSLRVRPHDASYVLIYSIRHREPPLAEDEEPVRDRCPIWLPTIPTDGRSRAVHIEVDLPAGSVRGDSMPAFAWTGTHGTATLGHLPSIVRVSFGAEGEALPPSLPGAIDTLAIGTFAAAAAAWIWRVRR
jgi:hypothetical protein